MLCVTRQGFCKYLANKDPLPRKHHAPADAMREINAEDECNDTYGYIRMYQARKLKKPKGIDVPGERTVYRVIKEIGLTHYPRRKPNGITKSENSSIDKLKIYNNLQ